MTKEYSFFSNWRYVFGEMCRYDGKYPWYIALKSMVTFLGPLLAAVIPSVAIFLVDQKASVSVFSVVLLGLVLGSFLLGVTSTKMDMVIRKKNYFVAYGPVQKKAVSKVLDVDYAFLETAEGKNWLTRRGAAMNLTGMAGTALWTCLRRLRLICWESSCIRRF